MSLVDNPYITFSPQLDMTAGQDIVAGDIHAVPQVLARIAADWNSPDSFNRSAADMMFQQLDALHKVNRECGGPGVPVRDRE